MGTLSKYVDGSHREEALRWKERYKKANKLADDGKFEEAVLLHQQNLHWSLKTLGSNHNCTVANQEALAQAFYSIKNFKEACRLDLAASTTRASVEGDGPPSKELRAVQLNLAQDYVALQRYKEAADIYERVYAGSNHDDVQVLKIADDLAACWHHLRDYAKARDLNQRVLEQRTKLGASDEQIAESREALEQNAREMVRAKKKKEEAERTATAKAVNRAAPKLEQNEAIEKVDLRSQAAAGMKGAEGKEAEDQIAKQKREKEEMEQKKLLGVEAHALERERLAKEARLRERAEKSAAERKARTEKSEARRAEAKMNAETWIQGKTSHSPTPSSIPEINVQRPQRVGWLAPKSGTSMNPEEVEEQFARTVGMAPHRPRASSQDSREIRFRHISGSAIFPALGSSPGGSSEFGDESHSPPGPWVSVKAGEAPWPVTLPWRELKTPPGNARKEAQQKPNLPSSSLNPDPALKSSPDPSRSRSLDNHKDKDAIPARAKSVSPTPRHKGAGSTKIQPYGRLFDAKGGKYEDESAFVARSWFRSLQSETQGLLQPLRKPLGKRVRIAILDTGVDLSHPDFQEDQAASRSQRRIKSPEDFLEPGGTAHDTCGHGTHGVGVLRKVAPEADIHVARVARDFDSGLNAEVVAKAIHRACNRGQDEAGKANWNVDIITMSFGFYQTSPVVRTAIRHALSQPVLVFAAASNDGLRGDMAFPASMTGVFCIHSASGDGVPSRFNPEAQAGKTFSIIGEDVVSAWTTATPGPGPGPAPSGALRRSMSGTSVAAPVAAAVAALVLEYVLQNDPASCVLEQLEEFKEYDGMSRIFARMAKPKDGYRNLVPWKLLTTRGPRRSITGQMEADMRDLPGRGGGGRPHPIGPDINQ